jgi:hypothetical protein
VLPPVAVDDFVDVRDDDDDDDVNVRTLQL